MGDDIVERLRQGAPEEWSAGSVMEDAAAVIELLRLEVDRLGQSLDKCHAKLMSANSPVHGPELERELLAGGRYRELLGPASSNGDPS